MFCHQESKILTVAIILPIAEPRYAQKNAEKEMTAEKHYWLMALEMVFI